MYIKIKYFIPLKIPSLFSEIMFRYLVSGLLSVSQFNSDKCYLILLFICFIIVMMLKSYNY